MTRQDFIGLVKRAANERGSVDGAESLNGIALHRNRVLVTEAGAIAFIRWQARNLDATWSPGALDDCAHYFKRVDVI
jgi:hypothetical protein